MSWLGSASCLILLLVLARVSVCGAIICDQFCNCNISTNTAGLQKLAGSLLWFQHPSASNPVQIIGLSLAIHEDDRPHNKSNHHPDYHHHHAIAAAFVSGVLTADACTCKLSLLHTALALAPLSLSGADLDTVSRTKL